MRSSITNTLKDYCAKNGVPQPRDIVDMGCSVGMSSRWLKEVRGRCAKDGVPQPKDVWMFCGHELAMAEGGEVLCFAWDPSSFTAVLHACSVVIFHAQ